MVWTENDANFIINIYEKHLQIFCKVLTYFSIYLLSQKTSFKAFSAYLYTIYCDSCTEETFDISFLFSFTIKLKVQGATMKDGACIFGQHGNEILYFY